MEDAIEVPPESSLEDEVAQLTEAAQALAEDYPDAMEAAPADPADQVDEEAVIDALAEEAFDRPDSAPRRSRAALDATAESTDLGTEAGNTQPASPQQEALVDDFLSGLDDEDEDLDEALEASSAPKAAQDVNSPDSAAAAAASAADIAEAQRRGDRVDRDVKPRRGNGEATSATSSTPGLRREEPRNWRPSWGMLAAVAIALLLLGVGGFGVLEQRSATQEQIRDLQARLSTAVTPGQAEAYREREAELELRVENLNAEIERLTASNQGLRAQVGELEAAQRDSQAAIDAERSRAEAAIADARTRAGQATEPAAAVSAPVEPEVAAPGGRWFVNFGSYAARPVAADWARRLEVDAGRVVIQSIQSEGRSLHRLRVVGLADRDAAERIATQLERRFDLPRLWVGRE